SNRWGLRRRCRSRRCPGRCRHHRGSRGCPACRPRILPAIRSGTAATGSPPPGRNGPADGLGPWGRRRNQNRNRPCRKTQAGACVDNKGESCTVQARLLCRDLLLVSFSPSERGTRFREL
ncbi:unnamed protein product, partial [Ectocarpus sp. 4 AP-2014]